VAQPPQKADGPKLGANGKPLAGLDARDPGLGKIHKTDELADTCQHLEEEIEELKVKYEMYFLGVERLEPAKWRDDLKKNIARLKSAFTRNTGLRFRIGSLHARYLSYERMWLRHAREKEDGTYRRDLFKARLRGPEEPPPPVRTAQKKTPGQAEDVDLSDWAVQVTPSPMRDPVATARAAGASAKTPAAGKGAPARPAAAAQPAAPSGSLDDRQMNALYDAYVSAKRRCNEDTSKLTYDAVAKTVSKQIPELMTRYKAKAVDFKVVIKDGKAILKAVPKP
jgi:HPt (histidine-containing phosphotransfer) domain-containing protein